MASKTKITIRKKPNKAGLYPLVIRITKNRKSTYIYIGHYIELKHWDEKNREVRKSHPNSNELNTLLLSKLTEANGKLMELQSNSKDVSANQVKKQIVSNNKFGNFYEVKVS